MSICKSTDVPPLAALGPAVTGDQIPFILLAYLVCPDTLASLTARICGLLLLSTAIATETTMAVGCTVVFSTLPKVSETVEY